jgi:hypothetical protein
MSLALLLLLAADYTTYLGGSGPELVGGMAVDYAGAVYVAGTSSSTNFPITSTSLGGPAAGHHCGFVTKLTPDGSALELSICIPDLIINAFALDPSGAIYLLVTNLDYSQSILKLDRNAQSIVYTTPFPNAYVTGIAVDSYGSLYLTGYGTALATTSGAYQPQLAPGACHTGAGVGLIPVPCADAFVAKLSRAGTVVYATYIGGSGTDSATAIAVDSFGNAWITGSTLSPDFPITYNALQKQFHGEVDLGPLGYGDAFVAELDPTGSALLYSTYLGGTQADGGNAIAVDGTGAVYVGGFTQSPDFPVTPGAVQNTYQGNTVNVPPSSLGNGFITKFDAGGHLIYSSYLGGMVTANAGSAITSLAVNAQRQVIAAGAMGYIVSVAGDSLVCELPVYGNLIASDGTDNLYNAGRTRAYQNSIATLGAFQQMYGGGDSDAVVQASAASRCFQAPAR